MKIKELVVTKFRASNDILDTIFASKDQQSKKSTNDVHRLQIKCVFIEFLLTSSKNLILLSRFYENLGKFYVLRIFGFRRIVPCIDINSRDAK